MKREIKVTNALRRELVEQFGTTRKTVHCALAYRGESELLEGIRREALARGGEVVITAPEAEVLVDLGDKLVQRFSASVRLECDKATGNVYLYKGEELCSTHHGVIAPLKAIQDFGKSL